MNEAPRASIPSGAPTLAFTTGTTCQFSDMSPKPVDPCIPSCQSVYQ